MRHRHRNELGPVALALLAFLCSAAAAAGDGAAFSDAARRDLLEVKKAARPGVPLTLNLAIPEQRRFAHQQLGDAGLLAPQGYGADHARAFEKLAGVHAQTAPSQQLTLLQMKEVKGKWLPGALITQLGLTDEKDKYYAAATLAIPKNVHGALVLRLFDSRTWRPIGGPGSPTNGSRTTTRSAPGEKARPATSPPSSPTSS